MSFDVTLGLGSLVGGVFNSFMGQEQARKNQKRQFEHEKFLADFNYQKNLEMWNRQNAYNTPLAQMRRFESAGLNKNLMYGQGTPGNANQMPQYQRATTDYQTTPAFQLPEVLSIYTDFKQKQAQTDLLEKQGQLVDEEKISKNLDNLFKGTLTEDGKYVGELMKLRSLQALEKDIAIKGKELSKKDAEISNLKDTGANIRQDTRNKITQNEIAKIDKWVKERDKKFYQNMGHTQAYNQFADFVVSIAHLLGYSVEQALEMVWDFGKGGLLGKHSFNLNK